MIKKLRRRFVLIIMLIMTVFVMGLISGIFMLMYQSEVSQSYDIMEATLSLDGPDGPGGVRIKPDDDEQEPEEKKEDSIFSALKDNNMYRNCFLVSVGYGGGLSVEYQMNSPVGIDELKPVCLEIADGDADDGIAEINGTEYRFKRERIGDYKTNIVFLDRTIEKTTLKRLLLVLSGISAFGIAAVFVISIFLARWATKPVGLAWEKQKRFVADASHELKTPLTVIEANMDVVESNPEATVGEQSKWLGYIRTETQRMSKLVYSLLYIAKADSGEEKVLKKSFNISETLIGVCLVFETLVFEKGRTLEMCIAPDIHIYGDEDKIKQLVTILIDNALKHSDENGKIYVTLNPAEKKGRVRIVVANTGEPIADEHKAKIFERFYRVDKSRSTETGGSGLGLSIAKGIVDEHGGTISVFSGEGELTKFVAVI